jgi:ubiquinone/menaquinone biosynthesis C-methylase UbiE
MALRHSYTLLAPIYDLVLERVSAPLRRKSLATLNGSDASRVLIAGIGSGLDIPHLPQGPHYTGVDLTPAMLRRAETRAAERDDITLELGDVMALPYPDAQFDVVVMHLILAVVPQPALALKEAERVLRPGGRILLLDKFLRPGQKAPLRRLLNTLSRHLATRTDVVFEEVLACCPSLSPREDRPALANGWFRYIHLEKTSPDTTA